MAATEEQALAEVTSEISEVVTRAQRLAVATPEQAEEATAFLAELKAAKDRSERARRFLVDPLNAHVRQINDRIKGDRVPLEEADTMVRKKLLAYSREQARRRAEEQARLDAERREDEQAAEAERRKREREAQQAEAAAHAGVADQEAVERARLRSEEAIQRSIAVRSAPAPSTAAPAPMNAGTGSAAVRREWKIEVVDISLLPAEYLIADERKLRAVVKAGLREIPGCKIAQVEGLAVRTR